MSVVKLQIIIIIILEMKKNKSKDTRKQVMFDLDQFYNLIDLNKAPLLLCLMYIVNNRLTIPTFDITRFKMCLRKL